MTKPADRTGELHRLTEAPWDERGDGAETNQSLGTSIPRCTAAPAYPDLVRLDGPLVRLGTLHSDRKDETLLRGCPGVELSSNEPASRSVSCWF